MAAIAHTLPLNPPGGGTGFLLMRVYGVASDGTRYPLPPDVEPVPGRCIVAGCDCGGAPCRPTSQARSEAASHAQA